MKPQRIVFFGLLAACVVLAGLWVAVAAGVGQGIRPAPPRVPGGELQSADAGAHDFALSAFETYAEVLNRPLFNEDRRPIIEATEMPDEDGPGGDTPEVALNVTVTGIIITPEKKLAMVTNNISKEFLRLKEGMQLDGDQASWTLSSIEPRKLVFNGGGQGTAEVKLETFTQALKGGAPPPRRAPAVVQNAKQENNAQAATNGVADSDDERAARAEEIRRRVAERRAELRAEADRRRAEAEQDNDG